MGTAHCPNKDQNIPTSKQCTTSWASLSYNCFKRLLLAPKQSFDQSEKFEVQDGNPELENMVNILVLVWSFKKLPSKNSHKEVQCGLSMMPWHIKRFQEYFKHISGSFLQRQLSIDNYHVKIYIKKSQFLLFSRQKVYKNVKFVYITEILWRTF